MTVKELKEALSKYPDDLQITISAKSSSMTIEIDSIEETYSWDNED